jgi:hypothetical protein
MLDHKFKNSKEKKKEKVIKLIIIIIIIIINPSHIHLPLLFSNLPILIIYTLVP